MPNLSTWLLRHTHDAVQGYVTAVQARIAATPKTSAKATAASHVFEAAELGAGWAVAEALLHAVSAVTKLILTCLKAKPAPASEDLFCALLHLLRLLSNTDTVCACRPLSRICAVLYGEFAPVLLEHGALDVCFAMVRALLLSLQHPEAPFKVHCQQQQGGDGRQSVAVSLPGSLGGLLVPHNLHLFSFSSLSSATPTGSTNSASTNGSNKRLLDLLCLQGSCSLPFRVKQDHIGAVALLKVVSTLYSSSSSGGGGGGSFSNSPPSTENALINALPRILCTLKVVHGQAQGSTAHAILLFQQHQQELLSRSPGALPLLLLHYCYFYLTFLQPFSRY